MKNLKLFVWSDVLWDYTNGIAFALAETKEQAIELLILEFEETHGKDSRDSRQFAAELKAEQPEIAEKPFAFHQFGGG